MTVKAIVTQTVANISNSSHCIGSSNTGPTIAYGTGTPATNHVTGVSTSASGTPVTGSMYINTSGTAGARVYFYFGGSWVAQTTP